MKIRPMGAELFHAEGHKDRRTKGRTERDDEANSRFCNFANPPKNRGEGYMYVRG
jgi:hypothetical protein